MTPGEARQKVIDSRLSIQDCGPLWDLLDLWEAVRGQHYLAVKWICSPEVQRTFKDFEAWAQTTREQCEQKEIEALIRLEAL